MAKAYINANGRTIEISIALFMSMAIDGRNGKMPWIKMKLLLMKQSEYLRIVRNYGQIKVNPDMWNWDLITKN